MTVPEPAASQRETDALARRIDQLDEHGTRGTVAAVGVVQTQLAQAISSIGELKGRMDSHEREHQRDAQARVAARRWMVATVIGAVAAFGTVIGLLVELVNRAHG